MHPTKVARAVRRRTAAGSAIDSRPPDRWYPDEIVAGTIDSGRYEERTVEFLRSVFSPSNAPFRVAEIGIWQGATSLEIARLLGDAGELHVFDYQDNVDAVLRDLAERGAANAIGWGSSYRYLDSYNWSLKRLMQERGTAPFFDHVYLDGAHTWAIDALTFFLCDALLKPNGHIDFDDYGWRLRGSSLDPSRVPLTSQLYTEEQIDDRQVKAIVELLVRPTGRYEEVLRNRIFRKLG